MVQNQVLESRAVRLLEQVVRELGRERDPAKRKELRKVRKALERFLAHRECAWDPPNVPDGGCTWGRSWASLAPKYGRDQRAGWEALQAKLQAIPEHRGTLMQRERNAAVTEATVGKLKAEDAEYQRMVDEAMVEEAKAQKGNWATTKVTRLVFVRV